MKLKLLLGLLLLSLFAQNNFAKDKKSNLVHLKGWSEKQIKARMKYFNKSLGVKCNFCHVKDKSVDLSDDITDPKIRKALSYKNLARDMMKMTDEMNEKYLSWNHGSGRPADKIDCMFCHRGSTDKLVKRHMVFTKPENKLIPKDK